MLVPAVAATPSWRARPRRALARHVSPENCSRAVATHVMAGSAQSGSGPRGRGDAGQAELGRAQREGRRTAGQGSEGREDGGEGGGMGEGNESSRSVRDTEAGRGRAGWRQPSQVRWVWRRATWDGDCRGQRQRPQNPTGRIPRSSMLWLYRRAVVRGVRRRRLRPRLPSRRQTGKKATAEAMDRRHPVANGMFARCPGRVPARGVLPGAAARKGRAATDTRRRYRGKGVADGGCILKRSTPRGDRKATFASR